jgi:hypothetical protein
LSRSPAACQSVLSVPHRETATGMAERELPPLPELSHVAALFAHVLSGSGREAPQEHFSSESTNISPLVFLL